MRRLAIAIGVALLAIALVWLWRAVATSPVTAEPARAPQLAAAAAPTGEPTAPAAVALAGVEAAPAPAADKLDPMSDEFQSRFIEMVPHRLSRNAVECYNHRTGSLHRNQKLVLSFNVRVRGGHVSVHDVKVKPPDPEDADDPDQRSNTLNDPALASCFIQEVARTTWRDDSLPDYDWPDTLVIRPERGLKKFWKSNVDYVGAEAPEQPGRRAGDE